MSDNDTNALLAEIRDLMKDSVQRQKEQRQWYDERHADATKQQQRVIDSYKKVIFNTYLLVAAVVIGVAIVILAGAHR